MMRRLTLRARLTNAYAAVLGASLGAYAAVVFIALTRHLYADLDLHLHEEIEVAVHRIEVRTDGSLGWRGETNTVEEEPGGARWLEVWGSGGGERLLHWFSVSDADLGPLEDAGNAERSRTIVLPGALRVRTLTKGARIAGRPVLLRAARSEAPTREQLWHLVGGLGFALPVTLLAAALVGHFVSRRLLSPLTAMADRAERITAESLNERLPVGHADDELGRLARAFNQTLSRLERSFDQLRHFTADASHELRTPLTALRTVGEVGLRSAEDPKAYQEVIGSMLEEADRLTHLVDTLLMLARAEAGELRLVTSDLDLGDLAREVASHLSVLAEEKQQVLSVDSKPGVRARGDLLVLRQALINLVDNAIKYSPAGGPIRIVSRMRNGRPILEVVDRGPGIPQQKREQIFDRFYRVDGSSQRNASGAGLGLSLVKWVVEAHGGVIEMDTAEGQGSTFRLVLPPP